MLQRSGYSLMTASAAIPHVSDRVAAVTFDDGFADNLEIALPVLENLGVPATIYVVASEIGRSKPSWACQAVEQTDRLLTADELRQVQRAGWEIGSHCCQHLHLPQLPEAAQREELSRAKGILEDLLGVQVTSLAYPYGAYNRITQDLAAELGYTHAFTTAKRGGDGSLYALERYSMGGYGLRRWRQFIKLKFALGRRI